MITILSKLLHMDNNKIPKSIKNICKINGKIAELLGIKAIYANGFNWAEDMNSAFQLLDKFAENVAIQKCEGKWHINADWWDVSHESFPMAICLAFIKWKEGKEG